MSCVGIFVNYTLCFLYRNQNKLVNQNKGKITRIISMGQSKFSYKLTFWFISIENRGKQKSKNTFIVEINQFCDGLRDAMISSYAIDKM